MRDELVQCFNQPLHQLVLDASKLLSFHPCQVSEQIEHVEHKRRVVREQAELDVLHQCTYAQSEGAVTWLLSWLVGRLSTCITQVEEEVLGIPGCQDKEGFELLVVCEYRVCHCLGPLDYEHVKGALLDPELNDEVVASRFQEVLIVLSTFENEAQDSIKRLESPCLLQGWQ